MQIKINLENIQTLTDFKRNAKDYLERIKVTKSPIVLTVNGKAEVVVHEAQAFQQMIDELQRLEEELQKLKLEALRSQIDIGIKQLDSGEYTEYHDESLPAFFANINVLNQHGV
ncbi:type II toxin-antitoxin system Phd/YefM family antitoxin [Nostoc sp. ATCC 53789]|uniref:type II toxin-antitoxin system Phd/YefM family antitoxin n=1 Tax=Nostoc sp. ATCC 53789 TaxID=76335 RepID=UPI000DEC8B3F|nr:type II toxin-antitoxin system Phd/YefM family antitoxin [Nostoc sp. ATCC 53789]QHG16325.1 type II toxin-antitoxin system prevent-host-death family antitoxin [Nostoc sp. ATCC 53789]RCJ22844.1 prevent-host-death family protein [Nostoc sp. ATCC 53789]